MLIELTVCVKRPLQEYYVNFLPNMTNEANEEIIEEIIHQNPSVVCEMFAPNFLIDGAKVRLCSSNDKKTFHNYNTSIDILR